MVPERRHVPCSTWALLAAVSAFACSTSDDSRGSASDVGADASIERSEGLDVSVGNDAPNPDALDGQDALKLADRSTTADGPMVVDASTASDVEDAGEPCEAGPAKLSVTPKQGNVRQVNCTPTKPCPAGLICIGGSCGDVWECVTHGEARGEHPCPTEVAEYCGCDGVTFTAIATCPDRPYERVGPCHDGVTCNPTLIRCKGQDPPCPEGEVRSVEQERYGKCVPIDTCRCEFVWECPHREKYVCDTATNRCRALTVDP